MHIYLCTGTVRLTTDVPQASSGMDQAQAALALFGYSMSLSANYYTQTVSITKSVESFINACLPDQARDAFIKGYELMGMPVNDVKVRHVGEAVLSI